MRRRTSALRSFRGVADRQPLITTIASDVSRASEISVGMYLRSSPPSSSEETGMGNSDIFLGGIKVLPDFTVRADRQAHLRGALH